MRVRRVAVVAARAAWAILYALAHLAPRSQSKWVFGCHGNRFADNSKYLFMYVSRKVPDVAAIWISGDSGLVMRLRGMGYRAHHRWSLAGIFHASTAGVFVVSFYSTDVSFPLSGGARVVNLWHGMPLKRIEFDITSGPLTSVYRPTSAWACAWARFMNPHVYQRPACVVAPGNATSAVFQSAFRVPLERVLHAGFPRNDILLASRDDWPDAIRGAEYAETLREMAGATRSFVFLPTFRDTGASALALPGLDWAAFDRYLTERNWRLFVKLHPHDKPEFPAVPLTSIRFLDGIDDVYPLLRDADCLITDYSSVAFDFLVTRRPILFVPWDLQDYLRTSRDMYFEYDRVIPDPKPSSLSELLEAMESIEWGRESEGQQRLRSWMWEGAAGEACPRIVGSIRNDRRAK